MPIVKMEIPEVHQDITRVINAEIIKQFMIDIGVDKDIPVQYMGYGHGLPKQHSTLKEDLNPNRLQTDHRLIIDVTEEYIQDESFTSPVFRPEYNTTFLDEALHVYIKPIYQTIQSNVSLTYRSSDRVLANSWLHAIKSRVNQGVLERLHTVNYHYPIPVAFMILLNQIYAAREATAGYGDTIGDYLRQHFVKEFTVLSNQAGKGLTFAIREAQVGILGWSDFGTQPPKPQPEGNTGGWSVELQYSFIYQRCEGMVMNYPVQIHNKMLELEYVNSERPYELSQLIMAPNRSSSLFDQFRFDGHAKRAWLAYPGLPVPYYDDWLPRYQTPYTQCLMRFMMQIDPTAPTALLSLPVLGDWELKESGIRYMKKRPQAIFKAYDSVFHVTLHRWQSLVEYTELTSTDDLDIYTTEPMDYRTNYHLVISLVTDVTMLSKAALDDLFDFPEFAQEYLTLFLDNPLGIFPVRNTDGINGGSIPTPEDIQKALDYIRDHFTTVVNEKTPPTPMLNSASIIVRKFQ